MLTWRRLAFDESVNLEGLEKSSDLLDEIGETTHIRKFIAKQRIAQRFNIKVRQMGFYKEDLVVKRVTDLMKKGKLAPNWEGPYCVRQRLNTRAYKLESLEGVKKFRT